MSKYDSLARHLAEIDTDSITMTFEEISKQIPGGLPSSAYEYRPWWANRTDGSGSQNQGWQSVGWESSEVDMEQEKVTFSRVVKKRVDFSEVPFYAPLTIEQAKEGLAKKFNVNPNSIDIIIRG